MNISSRILPPEETPKTTWLTRLKARYDATVALFTHINCFAKDPRTSRLIVWQARYEAVRFGSVTASTDAKLRASGLIGDES